MISVLHVNIDAIAIGEAGLQSTGLVPDPDDHKLL